MKTRQLAKILEPAFRAYQVQMLPHTFLGVRLSLQISQEVMKAREESHVSLTWRDSFNVVASRLMETSGFDVEFAYVFDSEIHLLISESGNVFQRDLQRSVSSLAVQASLIFSHKQHAPGMFDCRISGLPSWEYAFDYFSHQRTNCRSHAVNAMCQYAMELTFPDLNTHTVNQRMSKMDHDARLKYAQAFGTLHRGGGHMCDWFQFGHLLKWTECTRPCTGKDGTPSSYETRRIDMRPAPGDTGVFCDELSCIVYGDE
jgi:hypothetical protein